MKKRIATYASAAIFAAALGFAFSRRPKLDLHDASALAHLDREKYSALVTRPLLKDKKLAELEAVHRSVLKVDPGHLGAKIDLGNLLRDTNRAAAALEWHRSARDESPENLQVVWEMMQDLDALGRTPEAVHGADILIHEAQELPQPLRKDLESFLDKHHEAARKDRLAVMEATPQQAQQPVRR
ncbi:MAG: hypothetical protein ACXVB9_12065 [Bdellovibrionota bacterium]